MPCARHFRGLVALGLLIAAAIPAGASAAGIHKFEETFGSASQPSFNIPQALAVDQAGAGAGDLYVVDLGVSEVQSIQVSASGGKFRLKFGGETTAEFEYEPGVKPSPATVQAALRGLGSIGSEPAGVSVIGDVGNYTVIFRGPLATTDVEQIICEDGTPPLSGGSGCSVSTTTAGVNSKVKRFNSDGTPHNFSALGNNVLDNLVFSGSPKVMQVAVDSSGGATDGDVYVNQTAKHLIDIFDEDGNLLGQLTEFKEGLGAGGGPHPLGEVCGVGVDPSGNVYVGEVSGQIHKYDPSADPVVNANNVANFAFEEACTLSAGVAATAGFVFANRIGGQLFKLDATSGELKYQINSGNTTVTVDPVTGHVYTATGKEVREYDASGLTAPLEPISSFSVPTTNVTGIAVDGASGRVYVAREGNQQIEVWGPLITLPEVATEAPSELSGTGARLNGSVDPEGPPLATCFFEYDTTPYKKGEPPHGETAPCEEPDAAEVGGGSAPVSVHAKASGLAPATTYHFRAVAENADGRSEGEDEDFNTLGPIVSEGSASQITGSGAKISGQVNPNGEVTTFWVEYVSEADFEESGYTKALSAPVPPQELAPGSEAVEVHQQLGGLAPGTTYHFRLVASNASTSIEGPDGALTTQEATSGGLPDGRAYEMVSPAQKLGEVIPPEPSFFLGGRFSASCGGECLPGSNDSTTPMQSTPDGAAIVYEGQPFFGDLAAAPNEYLARRGAGGWSTESLSPLLYTAAGLALGHSGYQAFSASLGKGVLLQGEPAIAPSTPSLGGEAFEDVYLTTAVGTLGPNEEGFLQTLVGEAPPNRGPGEFFEVNSFFVAYGGANAGTGLVPAFSHVVFEANDALTGEVAGIAPAAVDGGAGKTNLNLYEWVGGELRLVNVAPGNATTAPGAVIGSGRLLAGLNPELEAPAAEQAISDDGSRIFWSEEATGQVFVRINGEETQEIEDPGAFLTAAADGSKVMLDDGCLYDLEVNACEDLTAGEEGFEGILGASEDLSRIYFVDKAVLSGAEENANGETAQAGAFNLYGWEEGAIAFIGRLDGGDDQVAPVKFGDWHASPLDRTAQVSPDGRYLAFMSRAQLTGYDNEVRSAGCRGIAENPACFEVFEYDAETARLSCVSCNPSGQRPLGQANLSLLRPGPLTRQPYNLSPEGQGRLFFESQDELVPRDSNGPIQDVYQWEPEGVGGCKRTGGCVDLISSGNASGGSFFLDSSFSGEDAFFITRQQLLPQDKDERLDIYDARVGGGFPPGGIGPCAGEACKGPVAVPPAQQGPASSSFAGPGNVKPKPHKKSKHKKKHRRHAKERAAKHKRGGAK